MLQNDGLKGKMGSMMIKMALFILETDQPPLIAAMLRQCVPMRIKCSKQSYFKPFGGVNTEQRSDTTVDLGAIRKTGVRTGE